MLLPSSIQRADDLVGIAIPMVGLLWAKAPLLSATAARPAIAATAIIFSPDIVYSLDLFILTLERAIGDRRSDNVIDNAKLCSQPSFSTCEPDIWLGAAARADLEQEGLAVTGIGGPRRLIHVLPSRCNQETRQVRTDKGRTTGLPRRHRDASHQRTLRAVDIDAAATPAGVPDQPVRIDDRAVEVAGATLPHQQLRRARRQPGQGIESDLIKRPLR